MKKLFSSLLIALTVLITASPVRADGESISSVTVVGATEQSGTPTPNAPVDIVSNNGVLKVSPNLFKGTIGSASQGTWSNGTYTGTSHPTSYKYWAIRPRLGNAAISTYPLGTGTGTISQTITKSSDWDTIEVGTFNSGADSSIRISLSNLIDGQTYTVSFNAVQFGDVANNTFPIFNNIQVEKGSTATTYHPYGSIYTEGAGETIADSANHTATVETLFAVGDYADEQNINTGVITRKVGVKVLDGTENWSLWRKGYTTMVLRGIARARTVPLSNITESVSSKIELDGSADLCFYNIVTDFPTVTDWKRYIADQYAAGTPVIVIYPLAEPTTESVAGQTMTTAPVIQNNGTIATTIRTLLQNGQTLVSNSLELGIKIATTAYNAARFNPVKTDLNSAVATIREIVTKTINQTAAIASLQADKQTRPEDACPAGKKCLLVETEENGVIVPHWFPIIEVPEE